MKWKNEVEMEEGGKGRGRERGIRVYMYNLQVLLDSLVKPEEVIDPDEDLDDVEGEIHNLGEGQIDGQIDR